MRLIIIAKLILLTAIIAPPVDGHVLMPLSYEQRQAAAQLIVIAETLQSSFSQNSSDNIIEFKTLSILKGRGKAMLKVSRSTSINEEKLTCCKEPGRYILFLRRGRNKLFESVNGDYGVVRLAE